MRRIIPAILLVAVLAIGGGLIATSAYQAGLNTAITTVAVTGGTVVAPVIVPAYGYGYGGQPFGFGFFHFLATLFFLFIVFGLLRAIFFRGGPGHRGGHGSGGWGGPGGHGRGGWGGPGGPDGHTADGSQGRSPWESRAHETFDDWHRAAHNPAPEPTAPADPA